MANVNRQFFNTNSNTFNKKPLRTIIEEAKSVDPKTISEEVITWLINNVEAYIDNQIKIFKIDLVLDTSAGMAETRKLQDLYRAIPDEEDGDEIQKCKKVLDNLTIKAYNSMKESKELLEKLFDRMIFYYEKVIPSQVNREKALKIDADLKELFLSKDKAKTDGQKKKIQEKIVEKIKEGEALVKFEKLIGTAGIAKFDYEAFDIAVQIRDPNRREEDSVVRSYSVPEGFSLWLELSFRSELKPVAMF